MSDVSLAAKGVNEKTFSVDSDSLNTNFETDYTTVESIIDLTNYSMVEKDLTLKTDPTPTTDNSQSIKAEEIPNDIITVNGESLADRINNLPLEEVAVLVAEDNSPEAIILFAKRLNESERTEDAKAILAPLALDGNEEAQRLYVDYCHSACGVFADSIGNRFVSTLFKEENPYGMELYGLLACEQGNSIFGEGWLSQAFAKYLEEDKGYWAGGVAYRIGKLWTGEYNHPVNFEKAKECFQKAAELGYSDCKDELEEVNKKNSQEVYEKAMAKLSKTA